MIVLKFGGTSVSTKNSIETICKIVKKEKTKNPVVVVSALSGVTDLLLSIPLASAKKRKHILQTIKETHIQLITQLFTKQHTEHMSNYFTNVLKELEKLRNEYTMNDPEMLDRMASFGEILSSHIITHALHTHAIRAKQVIASKLIVTDDHFGKAEYFPFSTKRLVVKELIPLLKQGVTPVVTGFIGSTKDGKITTLGRGGSDYTAAILGSCLNAKEIQIWSDVNGILTADPKIDKTAKTIPVLSYKKAEKLALQGAKVLYPKTVRPAIDTNTQIRIRNTFNPSHTGSLIVHTAFEADMENNIPISV